MTSGSYPTSLGSLCKWGVPVLFLPHSTYQRLKKSQVEPQYGLSRSRSPSPVSFPGSQGKARGQSVPSQDWSSYPDAALNLSVHLLCDLGHISSAFWSVCPFAQVQQKAWGSEGTGVCAVSWSAPERAGWAGVIPWGLDMAHRVSEGFPALASISAANIMIFSLSAGLRASSPLGKA